MSRRTKRKSNLAADGFREYDPALEEFPIDDDGLISILEALPLEGVEDPEALVRHVSQTLKCYSVARGCHIDEWGTVGNKKQGQMAAALELEALSKSFQSAYDRLVDLGEQARAEIAWPVDLRGTSDRALIDFRIEQLVMCAEKTRDEPDLRDLAPDEQNGLDLWGLERVFSESIRRLQKKASEIRGCRGVEGQPGRPSSVADRNVMRSFMAIWEHHTGKPATLDKSAPQGSFLFFAQACACPVNKDYHGEAALRALIRQKTTPASEHPNFE